MSNYDNFKIWLNNPINRSLYEVELPPSFSLSPFLFCEKHKKTVIVKDVGDYSMLINKDLTKARGIKIKTKKSKCWFTPIDILSTPSGSVLSFNEKVGDIFKKGCIYPVIIYTPVKYSDYLSEAMRSYLNNTKYLRTCIKYYEQTKRNDNQ